MTQFKTSSKLTIEQREEIDELFKDFYKRLGELHEKYSLNGYQTAKEIHSCFYALINCLYGKWDIHFLIQLLKMCSDLAIKKMPKNMKKEVIKL